MSEHFDWVMNALLPYINFTLFLIMAVYFFRKPLNAMASKRRQDYESLFAEAKRIKEQAEQQRKELDARLRGLDAEIASILEKARRTAEVEKQSIIQSAQELAAHLTKEASRVAEAELENAQRNLRSEIVNLVTDQVANRFKQELSPDKQTELVDRRVDQIQSLGLGKVH